MRRLLAVPVAFDLIIGMMRQNYKIERGVECIEGIPEDAELIGSYTDAVSMTAYFIFSHPSFEPVPDGAAIPRKMTVLHTIYH